MINFMGGSSTRQGFYYEDDSKGSTRPFSHSSSSCSSSPASSHHQQHGGCLVPLSQHQVQVQSRRPWDESSFPSYSGGGGGGGASQLDLTMMDSSTSPTTTNTTNNVADRESHEHLAVRRGVDFSEGGGGSTSGVVIEREHMFDKVVTPSDVGKLNRLVIPKQHAEKYFPLDSSTNEKGLLLNFEDRNGKPWRFRYSYWNSSQSYVMTKGWSRFVKEKKLDAGDVVSFQRGVGELGKDRLYIDWRRRPDAPDHHHHHHHPHHFPASVPTLSLPHQFSFHTWSHPFYLQQQSSLRDHSPLLQVNASINSNHLSHHYHRSHPPPPPPPHHHHLNANSYGYDGVMTGNPCSSSIIYLRSAETGAAARPQQVGVSLGMVQLEKGSSGLTRGTEEPMVFQSVPVVQSKAAAKRLRLFGVNMDCPISESEDDEYDILSSTAMPHYTMPSLQSHFSSSISTLHLRPLNGNPLLQTMSSDDMVNKGKAPMSLDFDI